MFNGFELPTLDVAIWVNGDGLFSCNFYEKPMFPNRILQCESALSETEIMSLVSKVNANSSPITDISQKVISRKRSLVDMADNIAPKHSKVDAD